MAATQQREGGALGNKTTASHMCISVLKEAGGQRVFFVRN